MKTNFKNQKPIIMRSEHNKENPYTVLSHCLRPLNGYQMAIMWEILANNNEFILNKSVIEKRLEFPQKKFNDAWKELESLGFISSKRIQGGVQWIIKENPMCVKDEDNKEVK